jgi:hypothetical protein
MGLFRGRCQFKGRPFKVVVANDLERKGRPFGWEWQMISNVKDVKKEKGNGHTCMAWQQPEADRFHYVDRTVWKQVSMEGHHLITECCLKNPAEFVWDLWWTKWYWNRSFFKYCVFLLAVPQVALLVPYCPRCYIILAAASFFKKPPPPPTSTLPMSFSYPKSGPLQCQLRTKERTVQSPSKGRL